MLQGENSSTEHPHPGKGRLWFNCEVTVEEIKQALKRLKLRKASGQDGIVSEHLKFGGQMLVIWLKQVLNAIVEMEKDNYCRIALTPVITKLLGVHNPCPLAANPGRARSAFTEADCIQKAHNL